MPERLDTLLKVVALPNGTSHPTGSNCHASEGLATLLRVTLPCLRELHALLGVTALPGRTPYPSGSNCHASERLDTLLRVVALPERTSYPSGNNRHAWENSMPFWE